MLDSNRLYCSLKCTKLSGKHWKRLTSSLFCNYYLNSFLKEAPCSRYQGVIMFEIANLCFALFSIYCIYFVLIFCSLAQRAIVV